MTKRLPHGEITLQEIAAAYPALALVAGQNLRLEPVDPETAKWLDGPVFTRWLDEHGLQSNEQLGQVIARRLRHCREGAAMSLTEADKILTRLELHLHLLPDEVWIRSPLRTGERVTNETRVEAVARYRAGESSADLAEEYDVDQRSITKWANDK